jgi:hypothetical protein
LGQSAAPCARTTAGAATSPAIRERRLSTDIL